MDVKSAIREFRTEKRRSTLGEKCSAEEGQACHLENVGRTFSSLCACSLCKRTWLHDRSRRCVQQKPEQLVGDSLLHTGYLSMLVLPSLAHTRTGQSERRIPPAPTRTHEWSSRLSRQRRIQTSAARHAWTRTTPRYTVQKAVFGVPV